MGETDFQNRINYYLTNHVTKKTLAVVTLLNSEEKVKPPFRKRKYAFV
jgi:hypothetical protein